MKIIVTGASGQFGRAAAELLLEKVPAEDLIFTTRNPEKLADFSAKGASVRAADFDDPESLEAAFEGGTRMLLISTARVGTRVGQHKNAIDAAVAVGVKHIIYTSILSADEANNPAIVKLDHRATEKDMEASGVAWTFLRDSQYAEAVSQVVAPIAVKLGEQPGSAGDGKIAFVSRDDCVACAVAVLTGEGHENKAYNLTGPELLSFPKAIEMIAEISGREVVYKYVTDADMQDHFDRLGFPRHASDAPVNPATPWSSDDMVTFEQAIREGYFDILSGDVEKLLGRKPKSLRDVLLADKAMWNS
jgi:NAD(P)H dehydrogenase (quinone)